MSSQEKPLNEQVDKEAEEYMNKVCKIILEHIKNQERILQQNKGKNND